MKLIFLQETKDQLLKNMGKLMKADNELPETEMEALAQVINFISNLINEIN